MYEKEKNALLMCIIMSFLLCACGKAQDVEESQSSESTVGNQETATEIKEQTTVEDVIPKEPESTEAPVEPAKEDCEACGGTGIATCDQCGGAGGYTCMNCNGSGKMTLGDSCILCHGDKNCTTCGGTGKVSQQEVAFTQIQNTFKKEGMQDEDKKKNCVDTQFFNGILTDNGNFKNADFCGRNKY